MRKLVSSWTKKDSYSHELSPSESTQEFSLEIAQIFNYIAIGSIVRKHAVLVPSWGL